MGKAPIRPVCIYEGRDDLRPGIGHGNVAGTVHLEIWNVNQNYFFDPPGIHDPGHMDDAVQRELSEDQRMHRGFSRLILCWRPRMEQHVADVPIHVRSDVYLPFCTFQFLFFFVLFGSNGLTTPFFSSLLCVFIKIVWGYVRTQYSCNTRYQRRARTWANANPT